MLADWAGWLRERLGEGRDAYVYLDNTIEGDDALRDALALRELVSAAPLRVFSQTATPPSPTLRSSLATAGAGLATGRLASVR